MEKTISDFMGHKVYNIRFYNLSELYNYLKSNPKVNANVFPVTCSDDLNNPRFYGDPLPDAIEYIKSGYTRDLDDFLLANKNLSKIGTLGKKSYKTELSTHGAVAVPALVAQGIPECMVRYEVERTKVVNILFNLSYPGSTSDAQIRNRGLATLYIIQTLEAKGYIVNFKAFELSKNVNELFHLSVDLKKPGDLFLDVKKCYYPMVGKEFLRRILFRIFETTPFEELSWRRGYGESCSSEEMRSFYKASQDDLVISSPPEMGFRGRNIYEDTLNLIERLKIEDEFDMKELKLLCGKNLK